MDYKEKLEKAKELYPTANADQRYVLECLFPELAESEDERIRKEILNVFKQLGKDTTICGRNYDYAKWISWLEKQGEQKSNPYSGTSFEYNGHIWGMCARDGGAEVSMDGNLKAFISSDASFIYPNIPQPNLANSAKTCKKSQRMISGEAKEALYNKPAWKPSDEQMDALHYVFQHYTPNATDRLAWDSVITLELMYRDLKKLRGE